MTRTPTLVITSGDPAGIGPEVTVKALARPIRPAVRLLIIGDRAVFDAVTRRVRIRLPSSSEFLHIPSAERILPGKTSAASGAASFRYLEAALSVYRRGSLQALVTAPVTKHSIERTVPGFIGHTEYLADALQAPGVVMMFASDALRVVLLTRHLPLRDVPARLTARSVEQGVLTTVEGLRRQFGITAPRLAICGVNPHAGESGLFGSEESRILAPALARLRRKRIRIDGPVAADGFFATRASYDAVLCAYHDQGLIPFKLLARDRGCQVSLGLPIVRTSPDHGSALDIAGRGTADPGSMRYAIELAARLARRAA